MLLVPGTIYRKPLRRPRTRGEFNIEEYKAAMKEQKSPKSTPNKVIGSPEIYKQEELSPDCCRKHMSPDCSPESKNKQRTSDTKKQTSVIYIT